ncbi:restriction endonuclease subunit S [Streptomyces sp. 35G-GA-8]|uniref:restriction endonuclease subunit S n=1 Tax=Streptomyces sp. 35G-GA-8 TaxID=2939434 RepID=UPI00201E81ED|nr:restriction endonuclease subunit S [Streptomyces sp. 35G-GA-8]MCL7375966.1 restriction endonuclease subunit S [Streptomyces sp. 35G-GA-8]
MGGLPEGWAWARLGDVAQWGSGGTPKAKAPDYYGGTIPWAVIGDMDDGVLRETAQTITDAGLAASAAKWIPEGAILIAMYGSIGKLAIAGIPITSNQAIAHAVPFREVLDAKYLFWYLRSQRERLISSGKGGTQQNISQSVLKQWPIPVPPLAEQHRIVEALEEQLSRLDAAERVLRVNHARIRALAARVTNFAIARAVPADQPTAPLPREADAIDRNLPRIPYGWSWERLGDIAEVVGGVTKDKKKQLDPDLTEVPYLRVANVQRGWLDLSHVATIRVPEKKAEDLRLETGDVLMNEGGDRDKLGRGWVWRGEVKDAIHQNHVFRARVHREVILPELLAYHANSSARWFEANGKQTTNLASISLKKIRNLPVPIPPAGEQPEILQQSGEQLDGLARVGAAVEVGLKRAVTLRSALLRKALTGNLTPQDPADESADTLLDRIAAEREAAKPARKAAKPTARPRKATAAGAKAAPAPTPAPSASVQQELFAQ